ncbi:hypothetical protein E2C01_041131 [Portunus trituberculatus]|uniref:Uncharacterized protein n=1 Tax=Portunus trituberculatus TaxID=210409 RepID=A0A5B7FPV1_PORTR|nr:hypothetical protein [Portunus trituberculatus]
MGAGLFARVEPRKDKLRQHRGHRYIAVFQEGSARRVVVMMGETLTRRPYVHQTTSSAVSLQNKSTRVAHLVKKSPVESVRQQRWCAAVGDQVARPVMDTPQGPRPVFPATSRKTHYSPAAASLAAQRFISLRAYSCHTLLPGNSNSCRSLTFNKEIRWPHVFTPPGMFSVESRYECVRA